MTETVRAEVVFKEERCNGVRLSEFQYTYCCDGKKHGSPLNLVTVDFDLEIVWIITRSFLKLDSYSYKCYWDGIQIKESNQNFFGNLKFTFDNKNKYECTFNIKSLPIWMFPKLEWCCPGQDIEIKIQVFKEQVITPIQAYDKLLENKALADVTFIIGDEEIPANRSLLSLHSDVFAKMFESDMTEKKTGRVEVTDIEPAILKLLLSFIYNWGKIDCDNAQDLLKLTLAADKYELRSLVDLCAYRVSLLLSVDNVVDALTTADLVKADSLKKYCIDFIIKNKNKIVGTESFEGLAKAGQPNWFYDFFLRLNAFD